MQLQFAFDAHQPPQFNVMITLILLLVALIWVGSEFRSRSASRNKLSAWRYLAFFFGLFAIWAALASPLAWLDHLWLTAHMVKHLLLMTAAAPLILLGMTGSPPRAGFRNSVVGHSITLGDTRMRIAKVFRHPVFCWLAGTTAVIGWHIPALFRLGQSSSIWHLIEDASFLAAGILFWRPVVSKIRCREPNVGNSNRWSIACYLFLATLPCDILSAFLVFCDRVIYSGYASAAQPTGLSLLQDQEYAGALMWVWITFAYLLPAIVVTMRLLGPNEARSVSAGATSID
jgi:putative membrane protein